MDTIIVMSAFIAMMLFNIFVIILIICGGDD